MPTTTYTLEVPGAVLTYDVHQPERASDHPPLFVFGSPMGASGFAQLVEQLDDRVVLTYDPRMAERSRLTEGGEVSVEIHGEDLHRVVEAAGLGPVDAFGSSGGAQAALPWVVAHPQDVRTLVAHEPPLTLLLPDADVLMKVNADIVETYQQRGFGPALAKFMRLVMHTGEFTQEYLDQPDPDPAQYGLPTEDDGSRDDPLLGDRSTEVTDFVPDVEALRAAPTRIVLAVGEETGDTLTARTARATAALLGQEAVVFPSHHGGFGAEDGPWPGRPREFAERLREVLAGA